MVGADVNRKIEYFQGIIDEVVIYSRVLSADEIKVLSNKPFNEVMSIAPKGKLAVLWGALFTDILDRIVNLDVRK